jgi:hypothetical protein
MKLTFIGNFNGQNKSFVSPDFTIIDEEDTLNYFFDEYLGSENADEEIFWSSDVSQHDDRIVVSCNDFASAAILGGIQRWVDVLAKELNNSVVAPFAIWMQE